MANENYEGFDLTIYNLFTLLREMYYTRGETETNFLSKSGGTLGGSLTIQGNLTVQGNSYKIDTEDLVVKDYTITLAKDNDSALLSMVGMVVPKYDGTNYGFFGWDADGYAYVGDLTDYDGSSAITLAENTSLQKIATIKDNVAGGLTDNVMIYDDTNKVFKKAPSGRYIIENNKLVAFDNDYKSLYHLGAFDTISGNTITRQTWYLDFDNATWYIDGAYYKTDDIKNSCLKPSSDDVVADIVCSNSTYNIVARNKADNTNDMAVDSTGVLTIRTSVKPTGILQYKLATAYTDTPIEGESILSLDSNMAQMIRQDVVDGLNLIKVYDFVLQRNRANVSFSNNRLNISIGANLSDAVYLPCNILANNVYTLSININNLVLSNIYLSTTTDDSESGLFQRITDSVSSGSYTFTASSNAPYIRFWIQSTNDGQNGYISNIMLNEGDHTYPYEEYNQKEHITNDEATLLKQEEEKCRNLWSLGDVTVISSSGDTWVRGARYLTLPAGTYTINVVNNGEFNYILVGANGTTLVEGTSKTYTFTLSQESNVNFFFYASGSTPVARTVTYSKIMLNEGSEAKPYQEYYGAIVHKVDIEPVLLWENSSPNSAFASGNISIKDCSGFEFIIYGCKINNDGDSAIQYFKVRNSTTASKAYISMTSNDTQDLYHRRFTLTNSTTIAVDSGYKNATSNNNACIPVAIYGTNVL